MLPHFHASSFLDWVRGECLAVCATKAVFLIIFLIIPLHCNHCVYYKDPRCAEVEKAINARQAIDEPGHLAVDVYDKTNSIAGLFVLPRSVHKSSFCHCKTHFYAGIDIVKCAFYWMIDFQSKS